MFEFPSCHGEQLRQGPTLATEPVKGKAPRVDHHNLIPAHLNEELHLGVQYWSAEFRCVSTQVLRLRGAVLDLRFRLRPKQLSAAKPKVAGPAPRAGAKGEEEREFDGIPESFLAWNWLKVRPAERTAPVSQPSSAMARSPILSFVLFGALALLGKRTVESFVGATQTRRGSVMTRRAEEEEAEEKVAAPGDRLKLKVLSPEGDGISVACSEVILPSATGQLGILANHAPMMSALDTGVLRFKEDTGRAGSCW
eukprot:Skav220168  [mRNA]  locus=scaffold564:333783:338694:- [translate_table: standard]